MAFRVSYALRRRKMAFGIEIVRFVDDDVNKWWAIVSTPAGWDLWFSKETVFTQGTYETADGDHGTFTEIMPFNSITFTWENSKHPAGSSVRFAVDDGVVRIAHFDIPTESMKEELERAWNRVADKLAAL
jgi:uncharacterized protein YndB with AHSA1/START domain